MLTKVNTSYLSFGENDLNEVLYLMQFKYYYGHDLIFSNNNIWFM
jgi:hypothetical protein